MKKFLQNVTLITLISIALFGCGTTTPQESPSPSEPTSVEKVQEQEEKTPPKKSEKPKKEEPKKQEPEDPPNVKFAKELQKKLKDGDLEGAIALFETIPEDLYAEKDMKILHASLLFSAKQYDKAQEVVDLILADSPDDTEALELCSLIAQARGDKAKLKTVNEAILKKDPYNSSINIQMAESYALNKKYKQALSSYRKALVREPNNADALFGFGQMSFYLDDLNTAEKSFKKILANDPDNTAALFYLGKLAYDNENYLRAASYAEQALATDPYNYDILLDLGTDYRYLGRYDDAIDTWKKATEIDPDYFLAYAYIAGEYDNQNKFPEALEYYHKVIELNPKYWYAYESTAILEWHEQNWESARKHFMKAWEVSGKKDSSYALMVAATYWKQKDLLNMKKFLQLAMKGTADKESVDFLMLRFFHDNYVKNAEITLKKNIEKISSRNKKGKMWYYLGLYYELSGTTEGAAEYYAKVTEMQAPMIFEYRLAEWSLGL